MEQDFSFISLESRLVNSQAPTLLGFGEERKKGRQEEWGQEVCPSPMWANLPNSGVWY